MSLTVFYKGSKVKFKLQASRRKLFALAFVTSVGLMLLVQPWQAWSGYSVTQVREQITAEQRSLAAQSQVVQEIRAETEKRLTALTIQLGEMKARVRQLDSLGERLADAAEIDVSDILQHSSANVAVGGPEASILEAPRPPAVEVMAELDALLLHLEDKQNQLSALESVLMRHHISTESFVAGRPVDGGWLSSHYGARKDPFTGEPSMHKGIDFANLEADAGVFATGAGVVTWSGERYGYGKLIEIDHGGGLKTRYGHCAELLVNTGDVVTRGQEIAKLGSTGRSTGPHVHYEVLRNERHIDPSKYVYREAP
ncbi:M23 family metallopeptidase [Pseudidiomarina sediminum]|uniref:M23 family metallopeptidase n=1 Tax=Pseudidiomarina sediminum TaxID=431675 RepID=UPI001C943CEA|nr:M23 family metallopeptidase [Pseudidiomarina sediminum]MBY6063871.1 M23 family metallopeptidase [Pseudidiomarina sediminum]